MKNVLTINVPFTVDWAVPYGLPVVNGILKNQGYSVESWDLSIKLTNQFENYPEFKNFYQACTIGGYVKSAVSRSFVKTIVRWMRQEIKNKISTYKPDIILLSVFSSQSVDLVAPISTWLRNFSPDSYILIGGRGLDNIEKQSNISYGEYFAQYLPINATYCGDAENDLLHVIESTYQGHYVAKPLNSENLVNVPPADWTGIDFSQYKGYSTQSLRIPFTASKGCVRQCTFCDVGGSWPKFVYRKGADVAHELIDLYHQTGINKIEFTDNLINGSISNFREMNTILANKLPNTLDYMGYAICRPSNELPSSDFDLAKKAGASLLRVGIESGSHRIRHDMKKKFTNEDINWFAVNCERVNIQQRWLLFCGYPSETEEDFQETLELLDRYKHIAQAGKLKGYLSLPMTLTSGSGFVRNYAHEYGLEHNSQDRWSDFFWTSTHYPKNTFEVRLDRWYRLYSRLEQHGYLVDLENNNALQRLQQERLKEVAGLEQIYQEYKNAKGKKNIIPIIDRSFNTF